ncbi:putative gamma-tubulin complex component GCP5 [Cladophialophora carrionii]|uniref:Spindle pole body component n=1 Tax=Cladophialophora carrionii TaxID=86049 RepID=A0A1C1CVD6_9EURO|nr:putative gamma-tubulin complex component GCP5 [Cladophialophora carrionii]
MASPTTMNNWLEALALTFIPPATSPTTVAKHKDSFTRRVKHHSYGRTNQFAVTEKLIGLEEKFQVLNRDDVAGELFSRRVELNRDHGDIKWLPDVLDLLLHLSIDPVKYSRVQDLEKSRPDSAVQPVLKWADIEAEDPIDQRDPIWQVPQYSDFSSDEEEEVVASSTQTSPASIKQRHAQKVDEASIFDAPTVEVASKLEAAQFWRTPGDYVTITEAQAAREVLFMFSGLPTSIFMRSDDGFKPSARYRVRHLESATSESLLKEAADIASEIQPIRQWLRGRQDTSIMQLIHSEISEMLADFERTISQEHTAILHQTSHAGVVSLLQVLQRVKRASLPLKALKTITPQLTKNDPVVVLNAIHNAVDIAQSSCNVVDVESLLPILLSALTLHAKSIDTWLHTGGIAKTKAFFIAENHKTPHQKSSLWHDWFSLTSNSTNVIPAFLKKFTAKMFTIGKTAAFLQHLDAVSLDDQVGDLGVAAAALEAANLIANSPLPFSATFEMILERHLTALLNSSTSMLKHILETSCGLTKVLDAFDYLYLGKDGVIVDAIENKMFNQIDHCLDMWNDRFLLRDLLAEAYNDINCVDAKAITIQTAYTSSRTMENRRRSVKILAAVSISYHLAWPLANIILPTSTACYQRIALTLSQVRRARHQLERRANFYIQHMPLIDNQTDTDLARLVYWQLLLFVNVLYAHLTSCVIQPLTSHMRERLRSASTNSLDDMISIHGRYISALEHACLSSKRMKPLRDSLISLLDLCVRFSDMITSAVTNTGIQAASRERHEGDFEASSFISAQSRRRRGGKNTSAGDFASSSDEDDDDDGVGEGYSTFVFDEDTSLGQEISKVRNEFKKHVGFLTAGTRAVARSSSTGVRATGATGEFEVGERFELLAESLEGAFSSTTRVGTI